MSKISSLFPSHDRAGGPGEALDEINGNVIGIWRAKVNKDLPIEIVGNGEQRRDFTHVDDIVDGLWRIGRQQFQKAPEFFQTSSGIEAWELGTGVNYSVNDLASMFVNKFGCNIKYIDDQPGNYRKTLCIDTTAQDILGWDPQDRLLHYIQTL